MESLFFTVANSEYCSDSLSDIKWNYTFDEFVKLSNNVSYYDDLKRAGEMDYKNQQALQTLTQPNRGY